MRPQLFVIAIAFFSFSCIPKKGAADAVYADYKLSGEEGTENITCLLKFYEENSQGETLTLEPPAGVSLDGVALQGGSAGLSGAYYEVQKPLAGFAGTHTIVFKNASGKVYKETFRFQPFAISANMGETVLRGAISLQLTGLRPTDYIRVLLTDTSFATTDINEIDTVKNGQLVISAAALRNVASGPVTLYLFKEEERRLKNPPASGGKLSVTYGLSREFELTEE